MKRKAGFDNRKIKIRNPIARVAYEDRKGGPWTVRTKYKRRPKYRISMSLSY